MHKTSLFITTGFLFAVPLIALAAAYDTSHLPYNDTASLPRDARVAISLLTDEGVLEGNPDGSFKPSALLNRAEFVKIVMGLIDIQPSNVTKPCFPDVATGVWYEGPVCRAKALGIVRGNALEGIPESSWQFKPARNVDYAEAVKVLVELYDLPHATTSVWYEGYLDKAADLGIDLDRMAAGTSLTRADMSRLVAGFFAYNVGELDELRAAQSGVSSSSSSSSRSLSSSSRSSSSSSSSSSSTSANSSTLGKDPYGDTSVRPRFALLGSISPVLGAATIFSNNEAIDVRSITVNVVSAAQSTIRSFLLYDGDRNYLGRAQLDSSQSGNRSYKLTLSSGAFTVPRGEDTTIYARADIASRDKGGATQTAIAISNFTIAGNGVWSSDAYSMSSSETYSEFQTARAAITSVSRTGPLSDVLISGVDRLVGSFTFSGTVADSQASLDITEIVFDISKSSNVSLSNVQLGTKGFPNRMSCTSTTSIITCSGISSFYGALEDGARTLEIYADIAVSDNNDAFVALSIGTPGTISSPGAIKWTDGTANFAWVPLESPIAVGTRYER